MVLTSGSEGLGTGDSDSDGSYLDDLLTPHIV